MCARLSVLAHWLLPRAARECTPGTCVREDCVARDDSCVLSAELESCEASEREHSRGRTQDIAPRFYERLKFRPIAERGVYLFMEWTVATRDKREGKRKGIVRHRAVARALHPRHRDDAAARASSRKRPPPASRAFALRATAGRLLSIHVERFNPALRLYERLGFGRSTIGGFICSWNGPTTTPNDPTLRLAQGCPELRRRATIQRSKRSRSQTWGESRTNKLVGRLSSHGSKGFPWGVGSLDRWELTGRSPCSRPPPSARTSISSGFDLALRIRSSTMAFCPGSAGGDDMSAIDRITMTPDVCGGRPCIRGLRIRVKDVLDLLAAGATREEILADYPYLEAEDITAVLEFAARQNDHPVLRSA